MSAPLFLGPSFRFFLGGIMPKSCCVAKPGSGRVYDKDFGLVADIPMSAEGDDTFVNDVIITKTAAYFTDTRKANLYKVRGSGTT